MFAPYLIRLLKPGNEPRFKARLVGVVQYFLNVYFE